MELTQQQTVRIGSGRFMQKKACPYPKRQKNLQQQAAEQGHSLIYIGVNDTVAGVLEMQPTIRPEARLLIQNLKKRGITPYIISGDHEKPTRNIEQLFDITHNFEHTMKRNFLISVVPGVINIAGVYLLNFGVVTSIGLFYAGTLHSEAIPDFLSIKFLTQLFRVYDEIINVNHRKSSLRWKWPQLI